MIDRDEINNYVDTRQKFRALKIETNSLSSHARDKHLLSFEGSSVDNINKEGSSSSEGENSGIIDDSILNPENQEEYIGNIKRLPSIAEVKLQLPSTLQTEPLAPNKVARLRDKDKKLYNMQKAKYEVT